MTKRIPLERLRDVSRQRPLREPRHPQKSDLPDRLENHEPAQVEWPVPACLWL